MTVAKRNTREMFFDAHAPDYEHTVATQDTAAEVDVLLRELEPGAIVRKPRQEPAG